MGVLTYEAEFRSCIAPARLFKALVLDGDDLIPKVAPDTVKSVEILEGDGGVGTIKKITFTEGSNYKYSKFKTEVIDNNNLVFSHSLIEGGVLTDKLEKVTYENKFVAEPSGGTVIKGVSKFHTKGDDGGITHEDKNKERTDTGSQIFKILDKYLLENPDAYN